VNAVAQSTPPEEGLKGIPARIGRVLRELYDGNQSQMAEDVSISRSAVNRIVNGKTQDVEESTIIKVARHAGVREEWLRTESGPMREGEKPDLDDSGGEDDVTPEQVTHPLTRAGGGPGRKADDTFTVDQRLIESEVGRVPGRDEAFWCRVSGTSMEPWIQDGSFCFCLRQQTVSEPGRYIVWWGQDEAQVCLYLAKMSENALLGRKYGPEEEYRLKHVDEDFYRVDGYDNPIRMQVRGRVLWPRATAQGVLETVTDQMGKMLKEAIN